MIKNKNLRIIIFIILLLLIVSAAIWRSFENTRTRMLGDECHTEQWQSIALVERYSWPGMGGTALTQVGYSVDELREQVSHITVKKGKKTNQMPIPGIQVYIQGIDSSLFVLDVGENGQIIFTEFAGNDEKRTYWAAESSALYDVLKQGL